MARPYGRIRSLRGVRTLIDETIAQMRAGKLTSLEAKRRIDCYRELGSAIMAENVMAQAGVKDVEPDNHPLGVTGGVVYDPDAKPMVAVSQRIEQRRVSTPRGSSSETKISIEQDMSSEEVQTPKHEEIDEEFGDE